MDPIQPDCPAAPDRSAPELVVYFDGGCPMCSKEINYYQRIDTDSKIAWEDVSDPVAICPLGYDRGTLLKRFHVKETSSGRIFSGAAGFARLWCALPGSWRIAGKIARIPGVTWLLEQGYVLTLRVRPWLVRRFF